MDIGGGRISVFDIDKLKDYPDADVVTISGLHQDTFEYFIKTYGKQLRAIRFFKNKFIEDLSLLGTLPQLEYVYFFANQFCFLLCTAFLSIQYDFTTNK